MLSCSLHDHKRASTSLQLLLTLTLSNKLSSSLILSF